MWLCYCVCKGDLEMSETVCTFLLENEDKKKLEGIADREHRSLSGQIRVILEEWILKHENSK